MSEKTTSAVTRRRLLLLGLAGATAGTTGIIGYNNWRAIRYAAVASSVPEREAFAAPSGAVVRKRKLGRTGLDIAVVGIGAGGLDNTAGIHRAVEKGMNYIDTSPCYGAGSSENIIGRAIRESPALRSKLVLATKWDAGAHMPKARMLESLDESLKRLGTDHVDVLQIHQLGDHLPNDDGFSRLDNPELYAAMEDAKKAGKARFFGATGHTGRRSQILAHAIDKDAFDMILVKMNVLDYETADMPALLAKANAKNVGVVVMKSQPQGGMIPKGFEKSKWNIYQANLRWALQKDIACVVHSGIGTDFAIQDQAIGAVHDELTFAPGDEALLNQYADALSPDYCRGCDHCVTACPEGIEVPSILRAKMYEDEYAWPAYARQTYAEIAADKRWSERCLDCDACSSACPYGVDAVGGVNEARRLLRT
jgi:predicted aldo/keto reductase-like oxidoreductase